MLKSNDRRRFALALPGILLSMCGATAVRADVYDTNSRQLTVDQLVIGSALFRNVVLTIGNPISGPRGTVQTELGDTYYPATKYLSVAAVSIGAATYYNVVVPVLGVASIGTVTGAATYDGVQLTLPEAQLLGGTVYDGVKVSVDHIVTVGGGMPRVSQNTYDPATRQLTLPVVQYAGKTYTNVVAAVGTVAAVGGSEAGDTLLYSFAGGGGVKGSLDGAWPYTSLTQGSDGNFYGTTNIGGKYGAGSVFRLTPSGTETVLYSFSGAGGVVGSLDGAYPYSRLAVDANGNLYGTTTSGGAYGQGTVFQVTPAGVETVLHSFSGNGGQPGSTDGASPNGVVLASDGFLYGTTYGGGGAYAGTVFRMRPGGTPYTVMHAFVGATGIGGGVDGLYPATGVIEGSDHNLYGTTLYGGAYGSGSVFRITPTGTETVLYSFSGNGGQANSKDGAIPEGDLIQASDGYLYGTTFYGGDHGVGTVYRVGTTGTGAVLYSFSGSLGLGKDGSYPLSGLIQASDGNLYGTTNFGGAYNEGVVYRLTTGGSESIVHSFSGAGALAGSNDAAHPNGVIQGSDGLLYGTSYIGGANKVGVAFSMGIGH